MINHFFYLYGFFCLLVPSDVYVFLNCFNITIQNWSLDTLIEKMQLFQNVWLYNSVLNACTTSNEDIYYDLWVNFSLIDF